MQFPTQSSIPRPTKRRRLDLLALESRDVPSVVAARWVDQDIPSGIFASAFTAESPAGTDGKPDFGYFVIGTEPATAPAEFWKKQPNQRNNFVFDSEAGKSAHDAVAAMMAGKFRGECMGAVHITILAAADRAYAKFGTTGRFNAKFPNGIRGVGSSRMLYVGPLLASLITTDVEKKNNAVARKNGQYYKETITVADMIPGDWVYRRNKPDYNDALQPGHAGGYWSGENAIYLGTFKKEGDAAEKPYFMGMGLGELSEADFKARLVEEYNKFKVIANTTRPGTAQVSDTAWTSIKRLGGTGKYTD